MAVLIAKANLVTRFKKKGEHLGKKCSVLAVCWWCPASEAWEE